MARLFEYQGKRLLKEAGIPVPEGDVVNTPEQGVQVFERLKKPVMVKAQVWSTKRASWGGIRTANSADEVQERVTELLGREVNNFQVNKVLIEERLSVKQEYFCSVIIDDTARKPLVVFSSMGGTGIEEIAREHPEKVARRHFDIVEGFKDFQARNLVRKTGIKGKEQLKLAGILVKLAALARKYEARSAEINPLIKTVNGDFIAGDCRITVDDYAVYRHPELGIEIAREFDRPPTQLDKIAYKVEEHDYRGTFYFIQMEPDLVNRDDLYVGFHGAGGGGSMMSMDAIYNRGYKIANFTDTSGNPPSSKVYRAAKIILAQKGIVGYFGSGSGVASQEQIHSARGLVKAFREQQIDIPVVIRLGGNLEDEAVEILTVYTKSLPARVEGYKKDDPVTLCAERMDRLVKENGGRKWQGLRAFIPPRADKPYEFETLTGRVVLDHARCLKCENQVCIERCVPGILSLKEGVPVLNITKEEARKGKCIECLACEIECAVHGNGGGYVHLPIEGIESFIER